MLKVMQKIEILRMSRTALRCREIAAADIKSVVDLLTSGFSHERDRQFWERAMDRLSGHPTPPGFPRYGYLLDNAGEAVGVVLQIFSRVSGSGHVRCSMSSWYVMPAYRVYGSLLVFRALRHAATYTNATPALSTLPLLKAQGYVQYCSGRVLAPLWLSRGSEAARVLPFAEGLALDEHLTAADIALLRDHAAYGCVSLLCEADGRYYPFVFALRRRLGMIGMAELVYCSAEAAVPRFAGALGRYLARRGFPLMVLDADGPLPGVPSLYTDNRPKYFRGPDRPRVGDDAYSERAMFGVVA